MKGDWTKPLYSLCSNYWYDFVSYKSTPAWYRSCQSKTDWHTDESRDWRSPGSRLRNSFPFFSETG